MGIPNSQLETWAKYVPHVSAQNAHKSIRKALILQNWPSNLIDVYLQGSYRNHTNVQGSSDVDVVVQVDHRGVWENFRWDVLKDLRNHYQHGSVSEGNKSIKVKAASFDADVVVCERLIGGTEGMLFYTRNEGWQVINYPKLHIRNGEAKNKRTNEIYKPTVRIFKNMRNQLVREGKLSTRVAPSYFVECLIYNVPNSNFINICHCICHCTVQNVIDWLFRNGTNTDLVCQNGQVYLFGNDREQWSTQDAAALINALHNMWYD